MIIGNLQEGNNFSKAEQKAAQYIIKNKEQVPDMDIRQLADAACTSTATILRLCRKVGAKGFQDFKVKLSGETGKELNYLVDVNVPFEADTPLDDICKKIAQISVDSINETQKMLRYPRLENIVRYLAASEVIDVYGIGTSKWIAYDFKTKMAQIGRKVEIEQETTQYYYQAINADSHTHSAIIISHSGETHQVVRLAGILKKKRIKIVLITSREGSSLGRMAQYTIYTGTKEKAKMTSKISTYGSHEAAHYVLNCIFSAIFAMDYYENLERSLSLHKIVYSEDKEM